MNPRPVSQRPSAAMAALMSGLLAILSTLTVCWLTVGREAVTRAEVIELIDSRGPYLADRQALKNAVQLNASQCQELARITRELERQLARVESKLDLLVDRFTRVSDRPDP